MVWRRISGNAAAGYDPYKCEIIMPAVNSVAITEEEARKLNAFSYHERMHHVLSGLKYMEDALVSDNPKIAKELREFFKNNAKGKVPELNRGMHATMTNYIEDCRIELNKNYRLIGDLEDLHWYRKTESADEMEKHFDEMMLNNPWGGIMQTAQYNLCDYRFFHIDPAKYPEQSKMYDIAWKILKDGRFDKSLNKMKDGSDTSFELAKEIIEAWKTEANRDIEQEMKDEEKGKGKGKGKKGKGEKGEGEGEECADAQETTDGDNELFENENGEQEGNGSCEGDEEGKGKGKKGKGKPKKNDKKDEKGEEDGEGDSGEEEKEEQSEKDGEGTSDGPVIDEDGKRNIESEFDRDQSKFDGRYKISPNKLAEEASDMAREEDGKDGSAGTSGGSSDKHGLVCNDKMKQVMKTGFVPYNIHDRMCIPRLFPENYDQVKATIAHKLNMFKRELARILVGESQDRIVKYQKKGKLDRRRLSAILTDDDRIFRKITLGFKQEVALQLVIDLSGSMGGEKAKLAVQVACLFAEVLNALNIQFEVIGYNSSAMPYDQATKASTAGYSRVYDIVNHWIFKEFHESWSAVHARLGACCNGMRGVYGDSYFDTDKIALNKKVVKDLDGAVGGCNIDHETVLWGAGRLWAQPQRRKIQVVLADGLPSGFHGDYGGQLQELLISTNNKIVAAGIEQVAFGIMCEQVTKYYSKSVYIPNLEELGPKTLDYLSRTLRNHTMTTPNRDDT